MAPSGFTIVSELQAVSYLVVIIRGEDKKKLEGTGVAGYCVLVLKGEWSIHLWSQVYTIY